MQPSAGRMWAPHDLAMESGSQNTLLVNRTDWIVLAAIAAVASFVRVVFFSGFYGSDEVSYVEAAKFAAMGVWPNSTYIGALRLGVNLPIAAAIKIFGSSEGVVALYGLLSSVLEVLVVYWFTLRIADRRAALTAAILLSLLPLHVHLAGRIMADPPLGLFITSSFVFLCEAQRQQRLALYVAAGICAGFVYWIKESTIIFVAVLAACAFWRPRMILTRGFAAFIGATMATVAANFGVMWILSGDPLHLLRSTSTSVSKYADDTARAQGANPAFYIRYLLLNIWHTWLLGYLALAGVVASFLSVKRGSPARLEHGFLLTWAVGLVALFSLFAVSLHPWRWIPKQTNYMTIFLAPLCIIAATFMARIGSTVARRAILALYVAGGLLLCGLEQQSVRVLTANSKGSVAFAQAHPDNAVYVGANAERYNIWLRLLDAGADRAASNVVSVRELEEDMALRRAGSESELLSREAMVILDRQTLGWEDRAIYSPARISSCWTKVGVVEPAGLASAGHSMTQAALVVLSHLPGGAAEPLAAKVRAAALPLPADVYRVPTACTAKSLTP